MPKLKLRGWQFIMMYEALSEKYENELQAFYEFLCKLNGTPFENSYGEILQKKDDIIKKYRDLCYLCKEKIEFYSEKVTNSTNELDAKILANWSRHLANYEKILSQIYEMSSRVCEFRKIAELIKKKSEDNDFWPTYDDDEPSDSPDIDPDEWDRRTDALVY